MMGRRRRRAAVAEQGGHLGPDMVDQSSSRSPGPPDPRDSGEGSGGPGASRSQTPAGGGRGGGVLARALATLSPRAGASSASHADGCVSLQVSGEPVPSLGARGRLQAGKGGLGLALGEGQGIGAEVSSCCVSSGHEPPAWFRT